MIEPDEKISSIVVNEDPTQVREGSGPSRNRCSDEVKGLAIDVAMPVVRR